MPVKMADLSRFPGQARTEEAKADKISIWNEPTASHLARQHSPATLR
uniref:Uncharacterized protein n=1 Tax=Anguilla anguilla TaxID=7936 RepID=A0A0E9U6D4_ANGAN